MFCDQFLIRENRYYLLTEKFKYTNWIKLKKTSTELLFISFFLPFFSSITATEYFFFLILVNNCDGWYQITHFSRKSENEWNLYYTLHHLETQTRINAYKSYKSIVQFSVPICFISLNIFIPFRISRHLCCQIITSVIALCLINNFQYKNLIKSSLLIQFQKSIHIWEIFALTYFNS